MLHGHSKICPIRIKRNVLKNSLANKLKMSTELLDVFKENEELHLFFNLGFYT